MMQALYARSAARFASFHEPRLGWWRRRQVPKADKADISELAALEARLSLEEIAHFRAGVCWLLATVLSSLCRDSGWQHPCIQLNQDGVLHPVSRTQHLECLSTLLPCVQVWQLPTASTWHPAAQSLSM